MAVPKRKTSKSRKGMRRSHIARKIKTNNHVDCNHCGKQKVAHFICHHCNHYKGRDYSNKDK